MELHNVGVLFHTNVTFPDTFAYYDCENAPPHLHFSEEETQKIIETYDEAQSVRAITYNGLDLNYRRANKLNMEVISVEYAWVINKIAHIVSHANANFFKANLNGMLEDFEIIKYDSNEKSFYDKHVDYHGNQTLPRKLSVVIQLSDENDYEGGDTLVYTDREAQKLKKKRGTTNIFRSTTLHEVTPVTKGTRYALVGWISGPHWV